MTQLRDEDSWRVCVLGQCSTLTVHDIFNENFPCRWSDHGSQALTAPLPWPPLVPNLITPEKASGDMIRGQVVAHRCRNNDELLRNVVKALTSMTPQYSYIGP